MSKPWYRSRTIWLNALAAALQAIAAAAGAPAWFSEIAALCQAAAGISLRLDTSQPIA